MDDIDGRPRQNINPGAWQNVRPEAAVAASVASGAAALVA
jgi:hypothetical protein